MMNNKIIFMGTPDIAADVLRALIHHGFDVLAVYTKEPSIQKRGQKLHLSPVHSLAQDFNLKVYTPRSLRDPQAIEEYQSLASQALASVVVAYGQILPKDILDTPQLGTLNIHYSLLPRWRGAAPVQCAIEAGDLETGLCIMRMSEGLDEGPILAQKTYALGPESTCGQVLHDLTSEATDLLLQVLENYPPAVPQASSGVTYARKIKKEESFIDFNLSADILDRRLRAFTPGLALYCFYQGRKLKILQAEADHRPHGQNTGIILEKSPTLRISCGQGSLLVHRVQIEGKAPCSALDFIHGYNPQIGQSLQEN